jgi:hypothetical protein
MYLARVSSYEFFTTATGNGYMKKRGKRERETDVNAPTKKKTDLYVFQCERSKQKDSKKKKMHKGRIKERRKKREKKKRRKIHRFFSPSS